MITITTDNVLPLLYYLVGGFNPSEKILANGKDYPM